MEKKQLYGYSGPVFKFNNMICEKWEAYTYAVSPQRAKSNLIYRYKSENNLEPSARIHLPDKVTITTEMKEDRYKQRQRTRNPKYFDVPKQVKWYDSENEVWHFGIAFRDYIICGCCGSIIEICDLLEQDKFYIYKEWKNIDDFILKEENEDGKKV